MTVALNRALNCVFHLLSKDWHEELGNFEDGIISKAHFEGSQIYNTSYQSQQHLIN